MIRVSGLSQYTSHNWFNPEKVVMFSGVKSFPLSWESHAVFFLRLVSKWAVGVTMP